LHCLRGEKLHVDRRQRLGDVVPAGTLLPERRNLIHRAIANESRRILLEEAGALILDSDAADSDVASVSHAEKLLVAAVETD